MPKAITVINEALGEFERTTGLIPRVILLPRRIFRQYEQEQAVLDSIIPSVPPPPDDSREWADVRMVEHEALEQVEVY